MIGIDTNVVLRWLLDYSVAIDDAPPQTALAKRLFSGSGQRLFINHVVLVEVVWVLRNKAGQSKTVIKDVLTRLLASFDVEIDRRSTVESALASYAAHSGDFADHLIGKINRDAGCVTTLSFDKAASRTPDFTPLRDS
jgi:predicted nucleic-acid-binding protein